MQEIFLFFMRGICMFLFSHCPTLFMRGHMHIFSSALPHSPPYPASFVLPFPHRKFPMLYAPLFKNCGVYEITNFLSAQSAFIYPDFPYLSRYLGTFLQHYFAYAPANFLHSHAAQNPLVLLPVLCFTFITNLIKKEEFLSTNECYLSHSDSTNKSLTFKISSDHFPMENSSAQRIKIATNGMLAMVTNAPIFPRKIFHLLNNLQSKNFLHPH